MYEPQYRYPNRHAGEGIWDKPQDAHRYIEFVEVAELDARDKEIARLVGALAFYADGGNFPATAFEINNRGCQENECPMGTRARDVLERKP